MKIICFITYSLDVLKMVFIFFLGPPSPGGVPGEGLDCHFPKAIVGFGPIPARILEFLIFILALSTDRILNEGKFGFRTKGPHTFVRLQPLAGRAAPGLLRGWSGSLSKGPAMDSSALC